MSDLGDLPRYLARPGARTGFNDKLFDAVEDAVAFLAARGGGTVSDRDQEWLVVAHAPRSLAVRDPSLRQERTTRPGRAPAHTRGCGIADRDIRAWHAADGVPIDRMPWGRPWRGEGPA